MRSSPGSRVLVLAAALSSACSDPAAPPDHGGSPAAVRARIDSLVAAYLESGPVAGAAVAVVRGSDTLVLRGWGFADVAAHRAAGPATVYEIGSITKHVTAAAVMRLVEQGRLSLDDDLARYVPSFPLQGRRVTLRQLLQHTSGIPSYTSRAEAWSYAARDVPPDTIVAIVARLPFDFEPGTAWRYSNTGYVLLGMVIERVTGQSYAAFVETELFQPLGLRQLHYCPSRTSRDTSYATGYSVRGTTPALQPAQYISMTHPYAAGALCASAREFVTWQRALHGGRVLSDASYQQLITPGTLASGERLTYALGLMTGWLSAYDMIFHAGGTSGFYTMQLYVPHEDLTVVAFTNTDTGSPERLAINIVRAALHLPLLP